MCVGGVSAVSLIYNIIIIYVYYTEYNHYHTKLLKPYGLRLRRRRRPKIDGSDGNICRADHVQVRGRLRIVVGPTRVINAA